jgi:IPT/TIG domain-containing protein
MRRVLILFVAIFCASCKGNSPAAPSGGGLIVTSLSPLSGTTLGGTTLTIVGQNFSGTATVTVGGVAATDVQVTSERTITAKTGQHAKGAADVTVSLGGKTGTLPAAFTFLSPGATENSPPVIVAVTARGTRTNEPPQFADLGELLNVAAVVQDADTPPANLTYEYTSDGGGTITGSGPSVQWRAAASGNTPYTATITLTVTEKYNSVDDNGLPITKENKVTKTGTVSVHDSTREISSMATTFLNNFSRQISPTTVVQDFRDACPQASGGKSAELSDVTDNQRDFTITQFVIGTPRITIAFGGQCTLFSTRNRPGDACAYVPSEWFSTEKKTGAKFHVIGTDQVSAAFIESRWWLCESDFLGTGTNTATGAKVSTQTFKK